MKTTGNKIVPCIPVPESHTGPSSNAPPPMAGPLIDSTSSLDLRRNSFSPAILNQSRRYSLQAHYDPILHSLTYELVQSGHMSNTFVQELAIEIQQHTKHCKETNKNPLSKDYIMVLFMVIASCLITPALMLIPLGPTYPPVSDAVPWIYGVFWANATIILLGISLFFMNLLNVPSPSFRVCLISSMVSALCVPGTTALYLWIPGAVFPLPFTHLTAGVPACVVALTLILFPYRKLLLSDAKFRSATWLALLVASMNIVLAMVLVLYRSAFANSGNDFQSWFALILPIVKITTKNAGKMLTNRSSAPDFVHGAGVFSEVVCSAIGAVLFMSLKSPMTLVYLLAFDVIENLYHFILCLKHILSVEILMNKVSADWGSRERERDRQTDRQRQRESEGRSALTPSHARC
jgi:hypothetical protein